MQLCCCQVIKYIPEWGSVLISIPHEPVKLYGIKLVTCWKLVKSPANLSLEVIFYPLLGWTYGLGQLAEPE